MKRQRPIFWTFVLVMTFMLAISGSAQDTTLALTETMEISNYLFGFRMDYPIGWLTDQQNRVATINELDADFQRAAEGDFATQGYSIRFEFPRLVDLRELGLPSRDVTPDDLFQVNRQRYAYGEPTEVSELSFFSWSALRVRTVDGMGNEVIAIQGFLGLNLRPQPFLLTLAAPSSEALDAFLPTWEQMLDSMEMVKGSVNVGDYSLSFECLGEGSPTVILETGWGGTYMDWSTAMRRVAEFTHVCAANRRTELGDGAIQQHTDDLHTLLVNAHIRSPYVLVGWSYGGLVIRVYADEYSDEVVGMVFVDSSHEDQEQRVREILTSEEYAALQRFEPNSDFEISLARVAETDTLGAMPVIVLTAERFGMPTQLEFMEQKFRPIWNNELQVDLAHLSTNGRQIIVTGTTHQSLASNSAVPDAIREVVEEIQAESD